MKGVDRGRTGVIYKGLICRDWQKGTCTYKNCKFEHPDREDKEETQEGKGVCYEWLQTGNCDRNNCGFVHAYPSGRGRGGINNGGGMTGRGGMAGRGEIVGRGGMGRGIGRGRGGWGMEQMVVVLELRGVLCAKYVPSF